MKPEIVASGKYQLEFVLHENHPLRLMRARGRRVECVSGIVWITAYNQSGDFLLRPGMVFIVPNDRLALIEAIGCCNVRVEQPGSLQRTLSGMLGAGAAAVSTGLSVVAGLIGVPRWMRSRN